MDFLNSKSFKILEIRNQQSKEMLLPPPINLPLWLSENGHPLQPPVNKFCLYRGADYIVMAVGRPNERNDYHVNETEVSTRNHLNVNWD